MIEGKQAFGEVLFEGGEGFGGGGHGGYRPRSHHDSLAVARRFRIINCAKRERVNRGRNRPFVTPLDTPNRK